LAKRLLTRRWILTTILVIGGVALCIRLGIWQLDRLTLRRAFNARVEGQLNAAVVDLNQDTATLAWERNAASGLYDMEYRSVSVTGTYDFSQEVILRNQVFDGQLGYHVFTPMKIDGGEQVILVERGWIPYTEADPETRKKFAEPGRVTVNGRLRRPLDQPELGGVPNPTLAPEQSHIDAWNYINLNQVQQQTNLTLAPVYIQQAPDPAWTRLPYRDLKLPEITEGPHMGYALQWFAFAMILGAGYPFFVRHQLKQVEKKVGARNNSVSEHVH
jgi:surfeit locus 1 family protein